MSTSMKMQQKTMTFFWGKTKPTESTSSYMLDLGSVFLLSMVVECLSHTRFISPRMSNVAAGLIQTFMYGLRMGLAYLVMLAVMSFNAGVLLAAVSGYSAGFLLFGSRVFYKSDTAAYHQNPTDLPPLNC